MSKEEKFLKELAKLSQKHGIIIAGCGCCNSPFLVEGKVGPGKYVCEYELRYIENIDVKS